MCMKIWTTIASCWQVKTVSVVHREPSITVRVLHNAFLMSAYPHYCPFNLVWIEAKQVKPTVHLRKLAQQANKKSLKRTAKAINYFSSLLIFQPMCIKKNTFNYFNASSEVYKSTIYYQLKFSIFETCVILSFQALADFYAVLIWAGPTERVQELCFDMLCRIFTHVFFSPPFAFSLALLIWWGHCVHKLGSHKAGIVGVVCVSLRCRLASGRKDSTGNGD